MIFIKLTGLELSKYFAALSLAAPIKGPPFVLSTQL